MMWCVIVLALEHNAQVLFPANSLVHTRTSPAAHPAVVYAINLLSVIK